MIAEVVVSFNCCYTIVFHNLSYNPVGSAAVLVCVDKEAYERHLARLKGLEHIQIIQHGPSFVAQ